MNVIILTIVCTAFLLSGCTAKLAPQVESSISTESRLPIEGVRDPSGMIGIAVCDKYLKEVESCISRPEIPDSIRSAYRKSLDQNLFKWNLDADTEQNRQRLEESCQMALDSAESFLARCR